MLMTCLYEGLRSLENTVSAVREELTQVKEKLAKQGF